MNIRPRLMLSLPAIAVVAMTTAPARAQPAISWYTIDGGGGTSAGSTFTLSGTIGQCDAGPALSAGAFTLTGGFWAISGARHCGTADFNCDGDLGTDADIQSFFACLSGSCPPPPCASTADFNADGDIGTDADIEAFFRVLAGGQC